MAPPVLNAGVYTPNESVWCVGRNLTVFSGGVWSAYDWTNSAVPSNDPWYLDTRSISIDVDDVKWVGCAVSAPTSQVLIFSVKGPDAATGNSWTLSEFGLDSPDWEVPLIYASPYGQEILAFISPLNGGAGTGATCNPGATGGFLWNYNKITQSWQEVSPGYTWPVIHEIKAKGEQGKKWDYYLATDDGLQIINSGILIPSVLQDGTEYLPELRKLNKFNSSLNSQRVYSIDFDENGNYWLGTEDGLTYWDGQKFYNWTVPVLLPVTKVVSRPNGHVFFRCGNPKSNTPTTNGFYHFNGVTFAHFDSSNSNLPSDVIVDFDLATTKSIENGLTTYANDFWIISGDNIVLFDYVIPHIYASSKHEGTTGWNFLYYTPSATGPTSDQALLPKVQKYNWVYPSWQGYDNSKLALNHPGMDPRNLFLTADFKAIASGAVENQNYWNWGQIPTYEQQVQAQLIPDQSWMIGVTSSSSLFANPDVVVTSTTQFSGFNVVAGYLNGEFVDFGPSSNTEENFIFQNPNPSGGTAGQSEVGFVAFYTDKGQVQGVIPFRGEASRVLDTKPSHDGKSLIVAGNFTSYLEAGKFVWNTRFPNAGSQTITGITGPTGGPIGFSNLSTPGITGSFSYPWILNSPISGTGVYIPDPSLLYSTTPAYFIAEVDFELGDQTSYGGINFSIQSLESRFNLKNFRYFPAISSDSNPNPGPTGFYPSGIGVSGGTQLAISESSIRLMSNFVGGYSTLKNQYSFSDDLPSAPEILFSPVVDNNYVLSSFVLELNPDFSLINAQVITTTGINSYTNSLVSVPNGQTFLSCGTSTQNLNFGTLEILHPIPGFSFPWFIISDSNFQGITGSFILNYELDDYFIHSKWNKTVLAFNSSNSYFLSYLYQGNSSIQNFNGSSYAVEGIPGALQQGLISLSPGGVANFESSFEILPATSTGKYVTFISGVQGIRPEGSYYVSINRPSYDTDPIANIPSIGDFWGGGRVYKVDTETKLIYIAGEISGGLLQFSSTNMTVPSTDLRFNPSYSEVNTINIIQRANSLSLTSPAASWCQNLIHNGFDDWSLPTRDGLELIVNNLYVPQTGWFNTTNIPTTTRVWSSNSSSSAGAVVVRFDLDGSSVSNALKGSTQFVIPVRTQSYEFSSANTIFKRKISGTSIQQLDTFVPGTTAHQNYFSFSVGENFNLLISAGASGATGPNVIPYPFSSNPYNFIWYGQNFNSPEGVDAGNIVSRAGSGAWTWVDVHNSNNQLYVPMLSTVFFSNYDSEIFGKNNNRWVLSDARTGQVILDVKFTPYFIYTFTESGYYSIQNSVEDSAGNVYEISKPAFIAVVNQSIPQANDPNPLFVNSADYGFIAPNRDFRSQAADLDRSIFQEQLAIRSQNMTDFGSGLNIKDDENSTFRER